MTGSSFMPCLLLARTVGQQSQSEVTVQLLQFALVNIMSVTAVCLGIHLDFVVTAKLTLLFF